jgi:hypothetical protein
MKNFLAMPRILKMLTAMGFFSLVWVAASIANGVNFFGKHVDASSWWGSGAGYYCLIAALIMSGSSLLMLYRSRYGRPAHIAGWLAVTTTAVLGAYLAGVPYPSFMSSIMGNVALTGCIAIYLYLSKSTKNYFRGVTR